MQKMRQRDYLKKSAVKTNNKLDWLNYRKARSKVNTAVKAAKCNYFKKGIQENCRKCTRDLETYKQYTRP